MNFKCGSFIVFSIIFEYVDSRLKPQNNKQNERRQKREKEKKLKLHIEIQCDSIIFKVKNK